MDFVPKPSKNVTFACALELLPFRRYLELCVQIFRRDRSGPETHESGEYAPLMYINIRFYAGLKKLGLRLFAQKRILAPNKIFS